MSWQPIESAPKDGTAVDLWLVSDGFPNGWRETDARWVENWHEDYYRYAPDGTPQRLSRERDGWVAPGNGYDGGADFCDEPRSFNEHPMQRKDVFIEATHWMPPPEPPEAQK